MVRRVYGNGPSAAAGALHPTSGFDVITTLLGSLGRAAVTIALIIATLLYLALSMNRTVNLTDEGLVLFGAERVLNGDIPHRDFFTLYGPAQFYLLAALYKVFGTSVLVERVWDTVVRCCCVVLVFIIVRQVAPRSIGFLTAAASLVWLASFEFYGYPVFPALAAALGGVTLLAPVLACAEPTPRLIAAGACVGVVALFRYDVGFAVFGSECMILAFATWSRQQPTTLGLGNVARCLSLFGAGFAVVVAPVAIAFAVDRVIPDLVFDVVTYSAQYVKMRSLPFPPRWWIWKQPVALAVYLPLALCVAAVPTIADIARCRPKRAKASEDCEPQSAAPAAVGWMLLLLFVLTLVFFGKGFVRVSIIHMGMALVSSVALVGVLARPIRGRGLVGRGMAIAAVLATGVFTLLNLGAGLQKAVSNIAWASDPESWAQSAAGKPPQSGSCRVPAELARLACFRVSPAEIETVLYVQRSSGPDDPVLSGVSRHDRIFVNDIFLYFATSRKSVTKWHEYDPGLQTTAVIQEKMVRELRQARPKLVVTRRNLGRRGRAERERTQQRRNDPGRLSEASVRAGCQVWPQYDPGSQISGGTLMTPQEYARDCRLSQTVAWQAHSSLFSRPVVHRIWP